MEDPAQVRQRAVLDHLAHELFACSNAARSSPGKATSMP